MAGHFQDEKRVIVFTGIRRLFIFDDRISIFATTCIQFLVGMHL